MMSNFKVCVKTLVLTLSIMFLSACSRDPLDDIPLFEQYIKENINKKSDDPYISSTVKPEDPLYEYLYKLQQGRGYRSILDPLIAQGNTDAMVWKGRGKVYDIEARGETIALLGRAMAAGNPYAALALSSGGEECWHFGKNSLSAKVASAIGEKIPTDIQTCSKDNWNTAMKGFKKLAEQGDLSAQYFLLTMKRIQEPDDSREAHEFYIKEVIRFAKGYYYQPMMDYIIKIREINREEKNEQIDKLINDLLNIAANNNHTPAINKFIAYNYKSIEKDSELLANGIYLGSVHTIRSVLNLHDFKEISLSDREKLFYCELYRVVTGEKHITDEFEPDDKRRLDVQDDVIKTIENMKPIIYIDGFTRRTDWLDD